MAMSLPTLSSAGYLEDPAQLLDKQLAYFFVADYSQSNHHRGMVSSLPFLIKQYSDVPHQLISATEEALSRMLQVYFDKVAVLVRLEDDPDNGNEYKMYIEGTVTYNRREYDMYRLLIISNKTIANVSEFVIK